MFPPRDWGIKRAPVRSDKPQSFQIAFDAVSQLFTDRAIGSTTTQIDKPRIVGQFDRNILGFCIASLYAH